MARAWCFGIVFLCAGCRSDRPREEDPKDPEPRLRLSGRTISQVIRMLGDPDEVAEAQYFGIKWGKDESPLAAVFKYSKEQLYVYIDAKGVVMAVAKGSTKNIIRW